MATGNRGGREAALEGARTLSLGERADQPGALAAVPGLGNVTVGFAFAGSSGTQDLLFTITGFALTTPTPTAVLFAPRQSDNRDLGFPDQFAVQIIETHTDSILCRIRRLDAASGWGQNLRIDVFVID
jgi:hypothetical protein